MDSLALTWAGLRSFDREMPEEINRLVTDAIADYLLTPSPTATRICATKVLRKIESTIGNVMIDSLFNNLERAKASTIHSDLGIERKLRRYNCSCPSNVDDKDAFMES